MKKKGFAWTFNMFEQEYRNKPKITKVKPFIKTKIDELKNHEKYNSASGLEDVLNLLEKYSKGFDELYFQDIDFEFVEGFLLLFKE